MVSETIFVVFTGVMLGALVAMLSADDMVNKAFFALITIMVGLIGAKWCASGSVVEIVHGFNATSEEIIVATESIQTSELTYFYMFVFAFAAVYFVIAIIMFAVDAYGGNNDE